MVTLRFSTFGWVLGLLFVLCAPSRAESLEELDRILTQPGSLDGFLADKQAVNAYFDALQKYYGAEKIPRHRFDKVMGQLRAIVVKIPELKGRLWESTNLGEPFALEADVKGRGRDFKPDAWKEHFAEWGGKLAADARVIYDLPNDRRETKVQEIFDRVSKMMEDERATPAENGRGRVAQTRRNAEIFGKVKADPEVRAALAYVLREKLHEEHTRDLFRGGDPDVILHLFEKMRGEPRSIAWSHGVRLPSEVLPMLGNQVPALKDFMAREDIFPVKMRITNRGVQVPEGAVRKGAYQAVPIPRRFHGVWKGIPLGECVGGSPVDTHESWLTPERWLTVALKDTALWHVEREGGYHGFVQAVPIQVGGKTYGSLDFGSPLLAKDIQETDPVTGRSRTVKIFDKWMDLVIAQKPKAWAGYVVGQSNAINNAGVLPTARDSLFHQLGEVVGAARDMTHLDPLAARIVTHAVSLGNRAHYRDSRMIFDAGVADAGSLRALASPAALRTELLALSHAELMARKIDHLPSDFVHEVYETRARLAENADQALELAAKLLRREPYLWQSERDPRFGGEYIREPQRRVIENMIEPWLKRGDANWLERAKAFFAFDGGMSHKIFEETRLPHLDTAAKLGSAILDPYYPAELRLQLLDKHFDKLAALNPSIGELIDIGARVQGLSNERAVKLIELGYARARNIEEAATLLRSLSSHLQTRYETKAPPVPAKDLVMAWLAQGPEPSRIRALGEQFAGNEDLHRALAGHLMQGSVPTGEFGPRLGGTGADSYLRGRLAAESVDRFLALGPTAAEAIAFAGVANGSSEGLVKIAIHAAKHATSLVEYDHALGITLDWAGGGWDRAHTHRQNSLRLVEESMDNYFRLKPDLGDVKRLEERLLVPPRAKEARHQFDTAPRVLLALRQRALPLVKDLPTYFALAAIPYAVFAGDRESQPHMAAVVSAFLAATQAEAARLPPGPLGPMASLPAQRAQPTMTLYSEESAAAAVRLLEAALGKVKSFSEYLGLVASLVENDHGVVKKYGKIDFAGAIGRTLPRALATAKSPGEVNRFRSFFVDYGEIQAILVKRLIDEATSAAGVIDAVKALPRPEYGGSLVLHAAIGQAAERMLALAERPTLNQVAELADQAAPADASRGKVYEAYLAGARDVEDVRQALARMHEIKHSRHEYFESPKKTPHVPKPVADKLIANTLAHYVALGATFEDLKTLERAVAVPAEVETLVTWEHGSYRHPSVITSVAGIDQMKPALVAIKTQLGRLARSDEERYRAVELPTPPWPETHGSPFADTFREVQRDARDAVFAEWKNQLERAASAREFADRVRSLHALARGEDYSAKTFREFLLGEFLSPLMARYLKYPDAAEQLARLQEPWGGSAMLGEQLCGTIVSHGGVADFLRLSERGRFFGEGAARARAWTSDFLKKGPRGADVATFAGHWTGSPETQRHIFVEAGKTLPTRAELAAMFAGGAQSGTAELRATLEGMAKRFFSLPVDRAESVVDFWRHGGWGEGVLPVLLAENPADLIRALDSSLAVADAGGKRRELAREIARVLTEKFFGLGPSELEANRVTASLGDTAAKEIFVKGALEHFKGRPAARELALPSVFRRSAGFNEQLRDVRPEGGVPVLRRLCRFVGLWK